MNIEVAMDCEFSEFSFGYACIRQAEADLAIAYTQAGAPYLPSLRQEGGLGWDAKIDTTVDYALFLQFKRAEFVSRPHSSSPTWWQVGFQHYRISVDTNHAQHNSLLALETSIAVGVDHGEVFYMAPRFYRQTQFDHAYSAGSVLESATMFKPSQFAANDGLHHFVTVAATGDESALSDPQVPERTTEWRTLTARITQRAREWQERRDRFTLGSLERGLLASVTTLRSEFPQTANAPVMQRIHQLSAMLGCGVIVMVEQEDELDVDG